MFPFSTVVHAGNAQTAIKDLFPLTLHGSFTQELARHMYGSDRFSNIKSQVILDGSGELTDALQYRVSGRFIYDAVYDQRQYSVNAASDERLQADLRDTYLDYSKGPWDVRLGKQQIVWGDAVGSFVADIVNAKDYRQNILPDFNQVRIPEWGADIEYSKDNFHVETFIIPAPEFDKFGVDGAEFASPLPVLPGFTFTSTDAKTPYGFKDAKAGARVSYLVGGFDLGAFYVYSWTHAPVMFRTVNGGSFDFDPQHKRLNSFGGSFSKEIGEAVISGEFVFNRDNYFSMLDPLDADGITQSDDLMYVLGVDKTIFDKINVGVQFFQKVIFDYHESFYNERRVSNGASFRIARDFLNRKIDTEFLMLASLDNPDFLYRPSLKYNINSHWQVKIGMDIYAGDPTNPFGYYKSRSRYFIMFVYKF